MSKNHSGSSDEDTETAQPPLSEFATPECQVCGRKYSEATDPCHTEFLTRIQKQRSETNWSFRTKSTDSGPVYYNQVPSVVDFECMYGVFQDLCSIATTKAQKYLNRSPYEIPELEWVESFYFEDLDLLAVRETGIEAAISGCEKKAKQMEGLTTIEDVFAHFVYLDQFGLVPSYHNPDEQRALREYCADYYDVPVSSLDSEWLVERRIDRSKVYSTTEQFRREHNLVLVGETPDFHPFAAYKPFNGKSVLGDHRDHNLLVREAKRELEKLRYVDWTHAPHIIYSRDGYDAPSEESSGKLPILGFDFAGFQSTSDGETMQHLGIVTDREESNFEIYLQVVQMAKTHANGLIVMCNRKSIYRFLHYLQENRLVAESKMLPDTLDDYHAIPNVEALHTDVVNHIPLFDDIAILPRRKFRDEGFQAIDDLIEVETDA